MTVTLGGFRSAREWKLWKSLGLGGGAALPPASPNVSGRATVKRKPRLVRLEPETTAPWTLTSSPGVNGRAGTKLAPSPWE